MRFLSQAARDYVAAAGRMVELGAGIPAATPHHRAKDNGPV